MRSRSQPRIRSFVTCVCGALVTLAVLPAGRPTAARADESRPLVREIFVPFSDLNVLLENQPQRVLLAREQYEELLKKARKAPETHAPVTAAIVSADYAATIEEERARMTGTLAVDVLEDGLHALPLDLCGVGLRRATLDGQGASIGRASDGKLTLLVQGKGRHTLALEVVAPLETTAAQQVLNFRLPQPPAARLRMTAPGDVEIKSGIGVDRRVVDQAAGVTRFDLVFYRPGDTTVVMTLNSRLARRQRAVVAKSVLVDEVTQAYERLHATVSLAVLHQAVDRFRFVAPQGFEVTEVTSPLLSRWAIEREGDRRVLDVRLREQTVQTVVLNLSAVRIPAPIEKWTFPKLEPLDVMGQVAVVGLLVEDRLSAQSLVAQGLLPIDTAVLQTAVPESVLRAEPGAPSLKTVVAYYAPQGDFSLAGTLVRPPAELSVITNALLSLGDRGQDIRGGFLLAPKVDRLFGFDFSAPAGWHVVSVTDAAGKALAFERFDEPGKPGRIHVRLSEGVAPGKECRVYFQATATPDAWLGAWQSTQVAFPKFAVAGATRDQGALAVDARDDMVVRPEKLQALTPLDETEKQRYGLAGVATSLAYRYEGQGYQAALTVARTRPRLTARTASFFRVESDALVVHSEIVYQIDEARARQLSLTLPADTPAAVSIRSLDDSRVKESFSEPAGNLRRWNVLLEEPRRGEVRLAVDFQQPVPEGKLKEFRVPIAQAEGVAYQSGLVAVEGSPELDVQVSTEETTRRVDVGELVDAAYQPGRRLLGVWGFVGNPPPVKVSVARHPGYGLYPAIVQRAELSTAFSPDGVAQTSALFQLRTKAVYLEVVLPGDSELWSILIDDKPVKPQSEQGRLLVSLPAAPANQMRNLKIVYETPILTVPLAGQVKMFAPRLLLRAERETAAAEVPLADLIWHLFLPNGYEVIRADGTVVGQIQPPQIAALNVARAGLAMVGFNPFMMYRGQVNWRAEVAKSALEAPASALLPTGEVASPESLRGLSVGMSSPHALLEDSFEAESRDGLTRAAESKAPMPAAIAQPQARRPLGAVGATRSRDRRSGALAEAKSEALPAVRGRAIREAPEKADAARPTATPLFAAGDMPGMQPQSGPRAGDWAAMPQSAKPNGPPDMPGGMGGMPGLAGAYGGGQPQTGAPVAATPAQPSAPPSPSYTVGKPVYETKPKAAPYQARTEGLSSLSIDLQMPTHHPGQTVTFASLGEEPELIVTLANRPRLAALGWAIALTIALVGVARTNRSVGAKTRLVLWTMVIGTLVPLAPYGDTLTLPANMAVYAAALLAPYYLFAAILKWCAAGVWRLGARFWKPAPAVAAGLLVAACGWTTATADEPQKTGPYVIEVVGPPEPVRIPDDVVILPYDPDTKTGIHEARQILVPYAKYVELWNLAHPDKRLGEKAPPALFAVANGQYTATLQGEEYLVLEGQLEIDVFTDQFAEIPLSLQGGVLARAEWDGKPAQLRVAQPSGPAPNAPAQPPAQQVANSPPKGPSPLIVVQASGKGRHTLVLSVRLRLERRGGWRAVEGTLPAASATALALTVPHAQTEVRLSQVADRRSYETSQPGQKIETALGSDGRIGLQWRPTVGEAQVDRSLTAQSEAVLDVQEDGLRVVWQVVLEFRRSQRESFRLFVPGEYLVEKVEGANVRGWEIRRDDRRQVVDVALLKAAKDSERITLRLWRAGRVGDTSFSQFDCPLVNVADAALESGQAAIRRSPLLEVQTLSAVRATRIDLADKSAQNAVAAAGGAYSPLGLRPYEAYQFSSMPFTLRLSVAPAAGHLTANVETVLKVAAYERNLESRVKLDVRDRPIHRIEIFLPEELKLDHVAAPGDYQWTTTQVDKRPLLTILLAAGRSGEVPVVLRGVFGGRGLVEKVPLPRLEVRGAERQEGDIAVQADPGFELKAAGLEECESVLRDQLRAWLKPEQVAATALALHCRGPAYRGSLLVTARKADITCDTITNVRVTDRAVEETILLDFNIQQAGTRQLTFVLPAWMGESRIQAPMLRQKTIEPAGPQPGAPLRVRLDLQDEVMNKVRVLVEHDRLLTPQRFLAPIPVVESGTTQRQFVTLQSAGRDELIVEAASGLDALSRQQEQWRTLQGILGAGISQAYLVQPGRQSPQLAFTARARTTLVTAGARIGLAETDLVVDAHGAYRAELTYHVNNSTRQFFEIEMPDGATLWTAIVAGEPVKPVQVAFDNAVGSQAGEGQDRRRVRIPLVKTAAGDLDYPVVLKYGGRFGSLGKVSGVEFPLARTRDVEVELSHVRLFLPETHRFFRFGGTMRLAESDDELVAGQLSYETKQAQRLIDTMRQADDFAKVRAQSNLKQLGLAVSAKSQARSSSSERVQQELAQNTAVFQTADTELKKLEQAPARRDAEDNRARLNTLYEGQRTSRAKNVVKDLGRNFDAPLDASKPSSQSGEQLNPEWLANNQLANAPAKGQAPADEKAGQDKFGVLSRSTKDGKAAADESSLANPGIAVQQPASPPPPAQAQAGEGRRGGQKADTVERYQQRLEQQQVVDQLYDVEAARTPFAQERQQAGPQRQATAADMPQLRASERRVRASQIFGPSSRLSFRPGQDELSTRNGVVQNAVPAAGLVSLDFEVPKRGTLYRFTTPGGDVEITGQAVSNKLLAGLARTAGVLVVAGAVVLVGRHARRGGLDWMTGRVGSALMILLGSAILIAGFVLAGSVLIVLGIAFAVRHTIRKRSVLQG